MSTRIVLHYFDARGRAQFLRYYLLARGVPFEDERVALSEDFAAWIAIRDDQSKTGPFKKLPVLHYGDELIAETPVISDFLHVELGDAGRLDALGNRRHNMLASSLYNDILTSLGMLIWGDRLFIGVQLGSYAELLLTRLKAHWTTLDATLAAWSWPIPTERPLLADCLLWEMLDACQYVFGPAFVLTDFPTLATFYERCAGRSVFENLLRSHPCPYSARPGEADKVAEIQGLLSSA